MRLSIDMHVAQRMNSNDFADPQAFVSLKSSQNPFLHIYIFIIFSINLSCSH